MQLLKAHDGRSLAVESRGDPHGRPVFLLHGTPGSRVGPVPRDGLLYRLGLRLITFDRPGYGDSDRQPGRRVADAAGDVAAIADALGLAEFAVVGRSGGGPHSLACGALLPERTTRVAVLVGLAPSDAPGLDWYAGMADSNVREFDAVGAGLGSLADGLDIRSWTVRADPATMLEELHAELPESDRRVVADPGIRAQLLRNFAEALRTSADGWIDDALALRAGWGFRLEDVPVPVLLWHGEQDVFSPVEHARWLAARIPGARMVVQTDAAHFGALPVLPRVLRWAAALVRVRVGGAVLVGGGLCPPVPPCGTIAHRAA